MKVTNCLRIMLAAILAATVLTSAHADQKRGHAFSILNDIAFSLWHTSIRGVAVCCLVVCIIMFDAVQVKADSSLVLKKWAEIFIKPSITQHKDILWELDIHKAFSGLSNFPNQPLYMKTGKHGNWYCKVRAWAVADIPDSFWVNRNFTIEIMVFRSTDFINIVNYNEFPVPFKHKSETHMLPLGVEKGSHYDFETTLNWRPASEDAGYYFFICTVNVHWLLGGLGIANAKGEVPEADFENNIEFLAIKFYNEVPPDAFQVSITKPQGTLKSTQPIPFRAVAKDPLFVPEEIKTVWERRINVIVPQEQSQVVIQEQEVQNPNPVIKKKGRVFGSPGWERVYTRYFSSYDLEAMFHAYSKNANRFQIADPALNVSGQYRVKAISTPARDELDEVEFGVTSTAWQYFTVEPGKLIIEEAGKATVQPGSKEVQVKPGERTLEESKKGKVEKEEFAKLKTGGGFVPQSEKTIQTRQGESPFVPSGKDKGPVFSKDKTMSKKSAKPQLTTRAFKKALSPKFPELELKVTTKPAQVCPNKIYYAQVRVINHGSLPARYHLCRVGTSPQGCEGTVREIKGNSKANFFVELKPDPSYFEGGKWHGKLFLGKVNAPSQSQNQGVEALGGNNQSTGSSEPKEQIADPELHEGSSQSTEPTDCNVSVSTSWKPGGVGLAVGKLFCDSNMNNHLVKLEINYNPQLCNPKVIKKKVIKKQSQPGKEKRVIKPKIQEKQSRSSNNRKIIKPAIQEKRSKPGNKKITPKTKVEDKESKTIRKKTIIKPKIQLK